MISDYSWLVLCLKGHFIPVGVYVLLNLLGFVFGEEFCVELEGLGGDFVGGFLFL